MSSIENGHHSPIQIDLRSSLPTNNGENGTGKSIELTSIDVKVLQSIPFNEIQNLEITVKPLKTEHCYTEKIEGLIESTLEKQESLENLNQEIGSKQTKEKELHAKGQQLHAQADIEREGCHSSLKLQKGAAGAEAVFEEQKELCELFTLETVEGKISQENLSEMKAFLDTETLALESIESLLVEMADKYGVLERCGEDVPTDKKLQIITTAALDAEMSSEEELESDLIQLEKVFVQLTKTRITQFVDEQHVSKAELEQQLELSPRYQEIVNDAEACAGELQTVEKELTDLRAQASTLINEYLQCAIDLANTQLELNALGTQQQSTVDYDHASFNTHYVKESELSEGEFKKEHGDTLTTKNADEAEKEQKKSMKNGLEIEKKILKLKHKLSAKETASTQLIEQRHIEKQIEQFEEEERLDDVFERYENDLDRFKDDYEEQRDELFDILKFELDVDLLKLDWILEDHGITPFHRSETFHKADET